MKYFLTLILIFLSLSIGFAQVPTNDTCANATTLTITTASTSLSYPEIANATLNNEVGCSSTIAENYVDLWYQFTMPVTGHLQVNSSSTKNNFAIFDACNGTEIACWNAGNIVEGLTAGTTYTLRIFRTQANANTSNTFVQFKAIPLTTVNATCSTSQNIVVGASPSTVNFNLQGIPSTIEVGCTGTTAERLFDVWFDFTMPVTGNIAIKSGSAQNNFALYDACNGNEIVCFSHNGIAEGLTANTNYKIRVFRNLSGAMFNSSTSFAIRAVALATNNTCTSSQNISISQTETSVDFDLASSTQNSNLPCNSSSTDIYDLWYDFTMPIAGNVFINSTGAINRFTVYDACNGNEVACFTNDKLIAGLTVGTNYKIRLYRRTQSAVNFSSLNFTIKVFPQATNDTCTTATATTVTQTASPITFDVLGANNNLELGCATNQEQIFDVWYTFTMPVSGNIEISNGKFGNFVAIYDTCNGNKLGCIQKNGVISGLISGQNYKLRAFRTANSVTSPNPQTFSIKAIAVALNDTCNTAQNIVVSETELFVPFEIVNAQINNEVGCSGTTTQDYGDIWYDFTMPFNGNVYVNGGIPENRFALYNTCNGTEINCFQTSGFFNNLISGTTYKLRVFRTSADLNANTTNFNITAFQTVSNDDCTHAETITVDDTQKTINFELGGAEVVNETGCDSTQKDYVDVWYNFTLATNGNVHIKVTDVAAARKNTVSSSDTNFALFDACNGSPIACFNRTGIFTNLVAGTNYKLRVFRLQSNNQNSEKSFDIVLETTTLAIEDLAIANGIQLYPNPIDNTLNLTVQPEVLATYTNIQIQIYNTLGGVVIPARKITNLHSKLQVNALHRGLYFYTISTQTTVLKTGKILKQ